jgi:hypothetical protein
MNEQKIRLWAFIIVATFFRSCACSQSQCEVSVYKQMSSKEGKSYIFLGFLELLH